MYVDLRRTSLCINIYNLTPVESNSDELKFQLSRKVLVPRCRKPYYLHSLSRIYLSKHVYYLGIKIGSQVKHPNFNSSEFDSTGVKLYIFIHNEVRDFDKNSTQPEIRVNRVRDNESQLYVELFIWKIFFKFKIEEKIISYLNCEIKLKTSSLNISEM
jgi:hypothetical protein